MKKIFNKAIYILPLAFLYGCEPEFDDVEFNQGSADFSTTVAVGNSLFAGFQSNALSAEGQQNSLPNMVATQLKVVGGGEFRQPIIPGEAGQKGAGIDPNLIVNGLLIPELSLTNTTNCLGATSLGPALLPAGFTGPVPNAAYPVGDFATNVSASGPYNNVSAPGAQVIHLGVNGYAAFNPYFARFVAAPTESMLEVAAKINHTFFLMWIGNNDVLGYATTGGDEGTTPITPQATFEATYGPALDALTANNTKKGVIANIPDVTSIPFFTTVKWDALELSATQAAQLNAGFGTYNQGVQGNLMAGLITQAEADRRTISFKEGANGFVIIDTSLAILRDPQGNQIPGTQMRQIKSNELLTLRTPQDSIRCAGFGSVDTRVNPPRPNPITENYVLDANEISKIQTAVRGFNSYISSQASSRGLALVDANATLRELATTGITVNGIEYSSEFVTGGAFSLDGVHPSTQGYAVLANEFIDAINKTYSAKVPKVDVTSFKAIEVK